MKADHTTHDLPIDEIVLPVQQMFPNCQKYKECCFWYSDKQNETNGTGT